MDKVEEAAEKRRKEKELAAAGGAGSSAPAAPKRSREEEGEGNMPRWVTIAPFGAACPTQLPPPRRSSRLRKLDPTSPISRLRARGLGKCCQRWVENWRMGVVRLIRPGCGHGATAWVRDALSTPTRAVLVWQMVCPTP